MGERFALIGKLHWRRWGDEWVVFHDGSGQTHKLDSLAATLLVVCEEGVVALEALSAEVAEQIGVQNDTTLTDALGGIVEQCVSLGLIARVG